jgi:hypothetical protein
MDAVKLAVPSRVIFPETDEIVVLLVADVLKTYIPFLHPLPLVD